MGQPRVAAFAQNHVNGLAGSCNLVHSPSGRPYGENLAGGSVARDVVKLWVDERPFYNVNTNFMAAEEEVVLSADTLMEWPQKDNRRFLNALFLVPNLNKSIKFCTDCLGMQLLGRVDVPDEQYTSAFVAFGPEESHFVLEMRYNYGVDSMDRQDGFGHFGIATQDVREMVEDIRAKEGVIIRERGTLNGENSFNSVVAYVQDYNYTYKLIERDPTPEPLCQVMLRVTNLDRSIMFYEKVLGMKLLRKSKNRVYKYDKAIMGYANEYETTVLELTYLYGVTEYHRSSKGYTQLTVSTDDVFKSAEAAKLVIEELGGKITCQPGLNTKITSFMDPDGWTTVLVDKEDFLEEFAKLRVG
ncbi:Lactoylglutathione lyase [Thalictrum thalictroides]|uniref:Lactoylglutathione lyase n=1 Tax=Thalictrum thalictroides TaxID=46969 RepID=A0A7J6VPF4_THATH|nr:Lactoylglutathione lyase [Thalictrum thalictroides]